MFRRLDRYLATEILVPFLTALAFLFMLLFAMQLLRSIDVMFGSAMSVSDLGIIAAYLAPHFLVMAMPVSFLFAVMLAVGRWAEDREVLALAASGIAPWRLWLAPVGIGLVISLTGIGLGLGPEPYGLTALKLHVNELIKRNMAGDVKPGVFYGTLRDMTLYAQGVLPEKRAFKNVLLCDERDPEASLLVLAHEGEVDPQGGGSMLRMLLADGEIHRAGGAGGDYAALTFDKATLNIGVGSDLLRANRFGASKEELTLNELKLASERAQSEGKVNQARGFLVARARRVAAPLATVAFALCAVPLAMSRRGKARAIGAIATLGAYIGYYVLQRSSEVMAEAGRLAPAVAANVANVVFVVLGLALMRRAMRAEK